MVDSSQGLIKNSNDNKKKFKDTVAEAYEPLVDMAEIARENKLRKEAETAKRKALDEKIASILHEESVYAIKYQLLNIISKHLFTEDGIARLASDHPILSPQKSGGVKLEDKNKSTQEFVANKEVVSTKLGAELSGRSR